MYRVRINYRRILRNHIFTNTDQKYMMVLPFERGMFSKDTTRIARAHQHRNGEHHTTRAWEGLAGMGVSSGHVPCHTRGAHRMHLRSLWNCKTFLFQMVITSCISVQYLWKYGFAKSSDNLYAHCTLAQEETRIIN